MARAGFPSAMVLCLAGCWLVGSGCRERVVEPPSPQRAGQQPAAGPEGREGGADKLTAEQAEPVPPPPEPPEPVEPADPFHLSFELASPEVEHRGWVQVTSFFNQGQPARVEALWEEANRITVDTQNVRQLGLDLGQLPVDRSKSVVLRLNGQGIQLSSRHWPVVEFERGQAGTWRLKPE